MPASPPYAELHCVSNHSFLRGASHPEELAARAAALGYAALAITDECSLGGVVRAHQAARSHGIPLIVGTELRVHDGPRLVLLAADRDGYGDLCELISRGRRAADKGCYRVYRQDVERVGRGVLAVLLPDEEPALEPARWLAGCFPGRAWVGCALLRGPHDAARLATVQALAAAARLPVVATGEVHMHARGRRALQDTLTAIRLGTPLAQCGRALFPNGERHLRPREALAQLYPRALLDETVRVAERCRFSLDELRYEYPQEVVPAGLTADQHLRALTFDGAARRYPQGLPGTVRALLEHELGLIAQLQYAHYFLTVHDIVAFARARGILCQGRGSAANSAVCFCLGITEVDPARAELLFERFVSAQRAEPPDIDVDFEHQRREEVLQYVYAKYGRERAGLAATLITYRPRSAVRDVGKALGLAPPQVDRLAGTLHGWEGRLDPQRVREAGLDPDSPVLRRLTVLVEQLLGFPRHLSQHVGGMVIARGRLDRLVPIENAAMPERTVLQWDKDDLDALGLMKVDCLALGMLSAIRRTLQLAGGWRGAPLTLADIPAEDPATYRMIQAADTVGVFQIESRAQMAMLPRLRPATFYDLVVEVALVRPGPIQGGMVHPYLKRRQGLEPVEYPSDAVREVLGRTLGVPIFQEQVIRLAMVAAGFSAGDADQLRRGMAAWKRKGGLDVFERRLLDGMLARGYGEDFARRIWAQIQGFGEYGFPESHSASFALLAYASAYLKCHHPAAFAAGLLNSQPMGFYAPAQLVQDARRHGVPVRAVDVTASAWDCTLEPGVAGKPALRLGLRLVKGLKETAARRIEALQRAGRFGAQDEQAVPLAAVSGHDVRPAGPGRDRRGATSPAQPPITDLAQLVTAGQLDRADVQALADAGALKTLAGNRHQARWQAAAVEKTAPLVVHGPEATPMLPPPTEGQNLVADYASVGLTLGRHPLALLRPRLRGVLTAARLADVPHGAVARVTGIVINRQRPGTASGVIFMTLEDETGHVNVVVWQRTAQAQRRPLLHARLLEVAGTVEREGAVIHLVAGRLTDRSAWLGALLAPSRDFR
ncbi:MAG: error-prone DNA polymerase [Pseudomonadota bacterium]